MYTVLRIGDGDRTYPFLYEDGRVYWPDYNPIAFGKNPSYSISFSKWVGGLRTEPTTYIIDSRDTIACVPFRHEGCFYHQYSQLPISKGTGYYIEFQAITPDMEEDPQYISTQGQVLAQFNNELHIQILSPVSTRQAGNTPMIQVVASVPGSAELDEYLSQCYGGDIVKTEWEVALVDDDNIYWISQNYKPIRNGASFTLDWSFKHSYEFLSGLRFMAICKNTIINGENEMHVDLRSAPLPLTPTLYEYLLAVQLGFHIEKLDDQNSPLYTMQIIKPRIMDKTVQNVVEITAHSDSKANIIQPVFFRAREMAHIIVHPAVTENISINLDPYKSQVDRFYIKIEGTTFSEIGRVEGGIIFKIQGNLLPGTIKAGTYYILNQDAELVTTGKYTYES